MPILLAFLLGLELVVGGLAQHSPGVRPGCSPGWLEIKDLITCVKVFDRKETWFDARSRCQAEGADLARVENSVKADLMRNGRHYPRDGPNYYWSGLNDRSEEGNFRWLDNEEEAMYVTWYHKQVGLDTSNQDGYDCVLMKCEKNTLCGVLEVKPCDWEYFFVCEKPLFLSTSIPAPPVVPECRKGWDLSVYSGTCIKRSGDVKTWLEARKTCQAEGGDLIKIENRHTIESIASFHNSSNYGDYWIGLNDIGQEGSIHWLEETDEPMYFAWKEESPSNDDLSDCVSMVFSTTWKHNRVWVFENCDLLKTFICEQRPHLIAQVTARQLGRKFLCPRGWTSSSRTGTCLKLFYIKTTWDDARDSCKARGGDLVKVEDFDTNQLILNQIQSVSGKHPGFHPDSDKHWIGLRAHDYRNEFHWLDEKIVRDSDVAYLGFKSRLRRKAIRNPKRRWTNKTMPYEIKQRGLSAEVLKNITEAIKHWQKYTCINIPPKRSGFYNGNYVTFMEGQCRSYIGMNSTSLSQRIEVGGCHTTADIIHEIGHAIGFIHEHNRPDRDNYIDIAPEAFQSFPKNFEKISHFFVDTFGLPYDYSSVMHYPNLGGFITTHDKKYQDIIGTRQGLSFLDIKLANLMYKCDEFCKPPPPCPEEGYVAKDCQCYCQGKPGGEPIELCYLTVVQPKFTPWGPDFSKDINNTCVVINTANAQTGSWSNAKCDTANKYICERPQLSTGQIAEPYLPLMKKVVKAVLCRDGWIGIQSSGTCIKLFQISRDWFEARAECQTYGGDLVKIVDEEMDAFIMDEIDRPYRKKYWIGLNALQMTILPHWLDDVKTPNYTNYEKAEQGCYGIISTNEWIAWTCIEGMRFICERISAHPSTVLLEKQSNLTTDWELASGLVTIKCNADIAGVPSDVKKIHRLQISKLFVFYGVSFAFKIATITADQEKIDFPVPGNRNWTLKIIGDQKNLRDVDVNLNFYDGDCFDGGYYQCAFTYQDERARHLYGTDTVRTSNAQMVTITAPMKNLNLSVEPYKSDHVYKATDRVVLNCSVDSDIRKDFMQFEFEWRKGPAEGNLFYREHMDVRTKPSKRVPYSDRCATRRTSTFTIKGKPANPTAATHTSRSQGLTGHNGANVAHTPTQAVSYIYWCSARYGNQVVYSTRLNLTILEEASKQSTMLEETRLQDDHSTSHVLINCNADAVELPLKFTKIRGLQISRRQKNDNGGLEKILEFYPYYPVGVKNDSYIPEGRDWKVDLNGVSLDPNSSRNLSIGWAIKDPVCADNGIYQCTVTYVQDGLTFKYTRRQELKMASDMLRIPCVKDTPPATLSPVSPSPTKRPDMPGILNPSRLSTQQFFQVGKPLEIICNAAWLGYTLASQRIRELTLSRQVDGSGNMSEIATYLIDTYRQRFTVPPPTPPNWSIDFIRRPRHLEGSDPQPGVIKWVIKNPQLEDAGIYQCEVDFYDKVYKRVRIHLGQQYLLARAATQNIQLTVTPGDPKNEYLVKDSISVTCSVEGAPNLKISLSTASTVDSLYIISSKHPSVIDEKPEIWKHTSKLVIKLREAGSYTVQCDARYTHKTELSTKLTLRALRDCSAFNKHCLSPSEVFKKREWDQSVFPTESELLPLCGHTRWRSFKCLEILKRGECHRVRSTIQKSKIHQELYDFHCSTEGKMMLALMNNSVCAKDRGLFQDLRTSLSDARGSFLRNMFKLNNRVSKKKFQGQRQTLLQAFCEYLKDWRTSAVRQAQRVCGQEVGNYVDYIYRIQDGIWYPYCQDCTWQEHRCDHRILGFDLSGTTTYSWIMNNTENIRQKCSLWNKFTTCYEHHDASCVDKDYKLLVQAETALMEVACSEWGKQIRVSPCKRGMEIYKKLEDSFEFCHTYLKLGVIGSPDSDCRVLEGRLRCLKDKTKFNSGCGRALELYIARKFAVTEMIQYKKLRCEAQSQPRGAVRRCLLPCETILPGMNATVSRRFRFSWMTTMSKNLAVLCRDEGKLRACWNIREVACPHSAAREETRIWNDVLDLVCLKKTKRPEKDKLLRTFRTTSKFPLSVLNKRVNNCQRDLYKRIAKHSSISKTERFCKLIEDTDKCIFKLSQDACGWKCRQLVSEVWPIFLQDDVAQVRKQCYAHCPEGWSLAPSADTCIKVLDERSTWSQARQACGKGSDLVNIADAPMRNFITGLTKKISRNPTLFWIGLNDLQIEGEYRWLDETVEFTDSGAGRLEESDSEDCVAVSGSLWTVSSCISKFGYICERSSIPRCWEAHQCVRKSVGRHISSTETLPNLMDIVGDDGRRYLTTVCLNLTECFTQYDPLCQYTESMRNIKGFMDNFCSIVGWDLIAKAERSTCFTPNALFYLNHQTNEYRNSLQTLDKAQTKSAACREIAKSLYTILGKTRANCGIHFAILQAQAVRYDVRYQDNSCNDLNMGCWLLRSCLIEFTETPPALEEFAWVLMFKKINNDDLSKLCPGNDIINKCYQTYGHYCRNVTFVGNVETAINLLNHLCNKDTIARNQRIHRINPKHFSQTMASLREKCVEGFYESLTSRDRADLEEHYVDVSPHLSEGLCRRIEETEGECVKSISRVWLSNRYNSGENYRFWLNIWLTLMGDKLSSARETCHGINSCPHWSMRTPDGSTYFVLRGYDTFDKATALCRQNGGDLVDVTDINMMRAVSEFITQKVSVLKLGRPQYAYWIKSGSAWMTELFGSIRDETCPSIVRSTFQHIWHPVDGSCTGDKAFVICKEPKHCKVKSTCPTGWTLSPDGEACVRVVDPPGHSDGSLDVCRQDGTYLIGFNNKHMRRLIYDLLPLNDSKSFWVKSIVTKEGFTNYFTKNKAYRREWGSLHRGKKNGICAQMNIKLPMKLKNEDCSQSAGSICYTEPIKCNAGTGEPISKYRWTPKTDINLHKAECGAGWFRIDPEDSWCFRIYPEKLSWFKARARCRHGGHDLLDVSKEAWKSLIDHLNKVKGARYWIQRNLTVTKMAVPCRSLFLSDKKWHEQGYPTKDSCNAKHAFICEKPASKYAPDKCPKRMISYQDVCLDLITKTRKTWSDARENCRLNGGDLLKISNNDERKKFFTEGLVNEFKNVSLWLGLHQNRTGGPYGWVGESNTVELSTFRRTLNRVSDNSEPLCLMVQTSGDSGKTWKLEKCNNSSKYICEYPAFGTRLENCGTNWLELDKSSCIRVYSEKLTWSEGRDRCQEKGGHLVGHVTSNKRWQFLSERLAFDGVYWVGITDATTLSKGECRSIRQQSPKKLIMETATGRSCSKPREGYICERKLYYSASEEPDV